MGHKGLIHSWCHTLRNVSSEVRNVSLELRNVSSELRNVSLELRNVSLELRKVSFRTAPRLPVLNSTPSSLARETGYTPPDNKQRVAAAQQNTGDKSTVSPYKHGICTVRLCRYDDQ